MSAISGSMSRSAGTTTSTGDRRAAADRASATAGGVTPERCCGPGSSPARSIAPKSSARSDSDDAADTAISRASVSCIRATMRDVE